jgi:AraC-like DNA-binding protein
VVATRSIDEARETFGRLIAPVALEQVDRKAPFGWRSYRIALGPVLVAVQEYGAAFRASSGDMPSLFSVSFPLTTVGGSATTAGVTQTFSRGVAAYVHSPTGHTTYHLGTRYRGLQLLVRSAETLGTLGALLGFTPKEPLRFEPQLSLANGAGAALERAVAFVVHEAGEDDGLLSSPLASSRFGEAVLAKLLVGHAHNYSERLARIDRASDPRSVHVAAEYLEANMTEPIRMVDLAAVARVSVRALQIAFQKYRGCTPMEFVRERRLERARERLLAGGARASIAEIARECGFAHVGRFSARYRMRFGELPGETRARAR